MSKGFNVIILPYDPDDTIVLDVTEQHKDAYGADGDIQMRIYSVGGAVMSTYLDIPTAKALRKQLKRAMRYLES